MEEDLRKFSHCLDILCTAAIIIVTSRVRLNRIVMIEARLPSVPSRQTSDSGEEKGAAAEALFPLSGGAEAGPTENIRRTVTETWSAVMTAHGVAMFSHDWHHD